jgi:Permuted papain-like amidase enzyme, YaeF/YiiX, C92 family
MNGSIITFLKEPFQFFLAFCLIWFLYKDSNRIFRAFFIHLERKLLIVHSLKLGLFLILIYKFSRVIPFYETIFIFTFVLLLLFLALLTLKHVEFKVKGTINSKYKTFKYGSRLAKYLFYLLAILMNFWEFRKYKHEIKEKSKEAMYVAIFPVQKYVMVSITGMEFTKRKGKFITDIELKEIKRNLEPGDILLKRNDWQATNLGISGFWTHTGLYIGSLEELDNYFNDIKTLEGIRFSEKLREIDEKTYETLINNSELSVIEAIEEGVVVKPLSNIAKVDYFSAVRPRISKEEKLNAILKAFSFVGRPYDFYINMESNDAFICTEVIYKSFEKSITFEVEKKLDRKIVFPNSVVKKFAHERQKANRELDFVLFYDLDLKTRKAYKSNEIEFAKSYKRNIANYRKGDMLRYLSTLLELK